MQLQNQWAASCSKVYQESGCLVEGHLTGVIAPSLDPLAGDVLMWVMGIGNDVTGENQLLGHRVWGFSSSFIPV